MEKKQVKKVIADEKYLDEKYDFLCNGCIKEYYCHVKCEHCDSWYDYDLEHNVENDEVEN